MKSIYSAITIFALTSTTQFGSTEAILDRFFKGFGEQNQVGKSYDQNDTHIVIDEGDQEIGELIYHPANTNYESLGEDADEELPLDGQSTINNDPAYMQGNDMTDAQFEQAWEQYIENIGEENQAIDPSVPIARLDLEAFKPELLEQALALNEDFLQNSQFQFAEYLGLSMIQLIFNKNLESPDFIEIFKSEDAYQPALDAKLLSAQHIVEEQVMFFADVHSQYQTVLVNNLTNKFVKDLQEKEKLNNGFPDTDSMRIALFGQLAFQYEQDCQNNYKIVKDKVLQDCTDAITELLDQTS